MISRRTLLLDRVATLLLAAILLAVGLVGVWWWTGNGPFANQTNTAAAADMVANGWWPWVSAAIGVALILLGLRWLAAHVSRTSVRHLFLTGSGSAGRLDADASKIASAAAKVFAETIGVRDAKGALRRNRGQVVATLTAAIEPDADLAELARAADRVSAQLAQVLGRDDLRFNIELKVARHLLDLGVPGLG